MTISTRTPEGLPNRCDVCGLEVCLEPSLPTGDAPCPHCGQLLWWFRGWYAERFGAPILETDWLDVRFLELSVDYDSLDAVELVMTFEDAFRFTIPDEDFEKLHTARDVIRYLIGRRQLPPTGA